MSIETVFSFISIVRVLVIYIAMQARAVCVYIVVRSEEQNKKFTTHTTCRVTFFTSDKKT